MAQYAYPAVTAPYKALTQSDQPCYTCLCAADCVTVWNIEGGECLDGNHHGHFMANNLHDAVSLQLLLHRDMVRRLLGQYVKQVKPGTVALLSMLTHL
jgi:hypothetical protein